MRAGLCACLLRQQVDDVKLLKRRKNRDNDGRRDDRPDRWERDIARALGPVRTV